MWSILSEDLKNEPTATIESLPNYRRPSLTNWAGKRNVGVDDTLTIEDLIDLGFDPTRLKEISIRGSHFIFERIIARQIDAVIKMKEFLSEISTIISDMKVENVEVQTNLPLLIIQHGSAGYVLRKKIAGIHWEEAIGLLQSSPTLKQMNKQVDLERIILSTIQKIDESITGVIKDKGGLSIESPTYFVSWDMEFNQPKCLVDYYGTSLETVWLA